MGHEEWFGGGAWMPKALGNGPEGADWEGVKPPD